MVLFLFPRYTVSQSVIQSVSQSVNQSINQSIKQEVAIIILNITKSVSRAYFISTATLNHIIKIMRADKNVKSLGNTKYLLK